MQTSSDKELVKTVIDILKRMPSPELKVLSIIGFIHVIGL
jgi:hypothetical protein